MLFLAIYHPMASVSYVFGFFLSGLSKSLSDIESRLSKSLFEASGKFFTAY